ncbi:MAG: phosphotransferase [Rhizobiales bacterium]|nr:phosphotransferase [Hyphomicrobiales bacterium]
MIEKTWGTDRVMAHIASLDLWRGTPRVEPLIGGLTNLNFTVRDDAGVYVTRVAFDNPVHDIYQSHVATAMAAAAAAGISPRLHYMNGAITVMDFAPGGALRAGLFSDPALLTASVHLLKRLHALGSNLPGPLRYSYPFQKVSRYCAFLKSAGSRIAAEIPEYEGLCQAIEVQVPPFIPTIAHTDVLPQNFVRDSDGSLKLIDWDYSGIGHPMADLASMAVNGDIPRAQWDDILFAYSGQAPDAAEKKLFSLFCVIVSLMEYLWAPVQEIVSDLPQDTVAASMASTYGAYAPSYEGYSELNGGRFRTVLAEHVDIFGAIEIRA